MIIRIFYEAYLNQKCLGTQQQQVDETREREIEKLRTQILEKEKEGETLRRSVLRGHSEQMNALI